MDRILTDGVIFAVLMGILTEVVYRAINRKSAPFSRRNGRWIQTGILGGAFLAWSITLWFTPPNIKEPLYHVHFWMMASVVGGIVGAACHFVYSVFHPAGPMGEFRRPAMPNIDSEVRERWNAPREKPKEGPAIGGAIERE